MRIQQERHEIKEIQKISSEEVVTSTTTVITSTAKKSSKKLGSVSSPNKRLTKSAKKTKEVSENEKNMLLETSIEAILHKNLSTSNGSALDNIAYKEYKDAGDYWNKFPKTDYTYSELSPHRREIAPGQVGMPNMSRKSMDKHHTRVVTMIEKNPEQASYIRERYQTRSVARPVMQYDSGDEFDYNHFEKQNILSSSIVKQETLIKRFWIFITTIFYYSTSIFRTTATSKNESLYYTRVHEQKGKALFKNKMLSQNFQLTYLSYRIL